MVAARIWRLVPLALMLGLVIGVGALTGCLPEGWEQNLKSLPPRDPKQPPPAEVAKIRTPPAGQPMQIAKLTPMQFSPKAGFPPDKVPADKLQKLPPPQVTDIFPGGVRWASMVNPAIRRDMDRFYFTITFSQPIGHPSLNTPGATLMLATYPGKTPPGPRVVYLTGTYTPASQDQKTVLFSSHQYATDLVQAAGWQRAQEIKVARQSFTVQVLLFGTPPKAGQPVVTGATGIPLDGDKNGQAGGTFSAGFAYGKTMFP